MSTVFLYICSKKGKDLFGFPVEHRCHREILMGIGDPIGREIEYAGGLKPPGVRLLG